MRWRRRRWDEEDGRTGRDVFKTRIHTSENDGKKLNNILIVTKICRYENPNIRKTENPIKKRQKTKQSHNLKIHSDIRKSKNSKNLQQIKKPDNPKIQKNCQKARKPENQKNRKIIKQMGKSKNMKIVSKRNDSPTISNSYKNV